MVSTESLIRACTRSVDWTKQQYYTINERLYRTRPVEWLHKYYPESVLLIGAVCTVASHALSNGVPELYLVRNVGLIVTGMAAADYAVSRMKKLSQSTINKIGVVGRIIAATTIAVLLWHYDPYKNMLKNALYAGVASAAVYRRTIL